LDQDLSGVCVVPGQRQRSCPCLDEVARSRQVAAELGAGVVGPGRQRTGAQSHEAIARETADGLVVVVQVQRGTTAERDRAGGAEGVRRAGSQRACDGRCAGVGIGAGEDQGAEITGLGNADAACIGLGAAGAGLVGDGVCNGLRVTEASCKDKLAECTLHEDAATEGRAELSTAPTRHAVFAHLAIAAQRERAAVHDENGTAHASAAAALAAGSAASPESADRRPTDVATAAPAAKSACPSPCGSTPAAPTTTESSASSLG
jgi:hypothetical protein